MADEQETADTLVKNPVVLNFIAMGDWGRNGADHKKEVATQMGATASQIRSQFKKQGVIHYSSVNFQNLNLVFCFLNYRKGSTGTGG